MKRSALTADDLMRQLEEPEPKRQRQSLGKSQEPDDGSDEEHELSASSHEDSDDDNDSENAERRSYASLVHSDDSVEDAESSRIPLTSRISSRTNSAKINAPLSKTATASSNKPQQPDSFTAFGITPLLLAALNSMSIRVPTPVQASCIGPLLAGRDCIGNAKTGSGKTVAFALPILQRLSVDPYGIFALVLTPTRELAFQISEQFAVLGAALNIRTAVVVGGMDMMAQALELGNRPHIVVATPGRIVDHLKSGTGEWDLSRVKFLVLDEADRLLTPTFAPELQYLFSVMPKDRQTCLFTATWTDSIEQILSAPPRAGKQKPFVHRMVESVETVSTLKQHYLLVPSHVREAYLFYILCNPPESTLPLRRAPPEPQKPSRQHSKSKHQSKQKKSPAEAGEIEQPPPTIIFCHRPRTAAYITALLKTMKIRSTALHSRLTQRERLSSLSLFKSYVVPVLVSTDVGARGLDIDDVAMVINWDLPNEPEEYTHRVGRTARAGRGGLAVSFVTERDEERVIKIEERINTKLTEYALPEAKVLEKLNEVSTAKRLANMELHDSDFGKREEIHRQKSARASSSQKSSGQQLQL